MPDPRTHVNLAHFVARTACEGPGWRAALWVQGCPIHCPGCINPHTWAFEDREWIAVDELAARILAVPDIEGVTFVGGEPFSQAAALAALGRRVREAGLSVMTFTGYTYEQLKAANNPDWEALLAVTDLLADGPFIQERYTDQLPWVGSDNQRLILLTPRYAPIAHTFTARRANSLEVRVQPDGQLFVNGFAYKGVLGDLLRALRAHGLGLRSETEES
ncbi:MAG: 4Fe-4S single cluster domain-containing protein [Anaerolineae bacterium]|nr:4Fe-4S single cluster domain-containing protein [Anaerolineae bacterium]